MLSLGAHVVVILTGVGWDRISTELYLYLYVYKWQFGEDSDEIDIFISVP